MIRAGAGLLVAAGCSLGALAGLRAGGVGLIPDPAGARAAIAAPDAGTSAVTGGAAREAATVSVAGDASWRSRTSGAGPGEMWHARAVPPGTRGGAEADGAAAEHLDRAAERRLATGTGAIVLDGFAVPAGAVSASPRGFDPAGPRPLVLWRVDDRGSARLANGFSDADGNLHFPQVAEPGDPLTLVVAPADAPPPSRETSDPASLARTAPLAPVVKEVVPATGGVVLRIGAREATGAVLVAAGDGTLLGRFALPLAPAAAARMVDVAVDGPVGSSGLMVAQELPDGRRSAFQPVALPAVAGSAP